MARRRMISAELISDPEYNSLSMEAQNIFIRMLSISDDCGVVPANTYRLNTLINTPPEYKERIQEILEEIVFRGLGDKFIYKDEDFFAFKKRSFEDYQSYILKKATKSEYLRIPKNELDSSEIKNVKPNSSHIPISVRRYFAELAGLDTGNVCQSKESQCKNCGSIGRIRNNGRGWITLDGLNFDHIIPHRFNGGFEVSNFQLLCPSCNQKKKYADIEKYDTKREILEFSRISFQDDKSAVSTVESKKQKEESKKQRAESGTLEIIQSHDTDAFKVAFFNFTRHRKELKKPLTPMAEQATLKKLYKHDVETAIKMIEESISNGWQGIFELKGNSNGTNGNNVRKSDATTRATFKHSEQQIKDLRDFEESLRQRYPERS